jgi:hypothetical protein
MTIAIIVVLVLIAAILGAAAMRPAIFTVRRSLAIKAAPEKLFALVNDFHNWGAWSPYEKIDPTMTRRLSGQASGKGAIYEWDSKGKAGAGRMEIIDAQSPSKIRIKLDFIKPFEGHNIAEFTFDAKGGSAATEATWSEATWSEATWSMSGPSPFMAKLMGLFINLDRMIGKDFETGLANLKSATER